MRLTDHEPAWTKPVQRERRAALKEKAVARLRKGNLVPPFPDYIRRLSDRAVNEAVPREEWGFGGSRLYLAEFQGPLQYVKAGRSGKRKDPVGSWESRIQNHRRDAELHGFALVDVWVSPRVTDPESVERSLLDELRILPDLRRARREYFYGLSFDLAVQVAQGLSHWERVGIPLGEPTPLPPGYRDARRSRYDLSG